MRKSDSVVETLLVSCRTEVVVLVPSVVKDLTFVLQISVVVSLLDLATGIDYYSAWLHVLHTIG